MEVVDKEEEEEEGVVVLARSTVVAMVGSMVVEICHNDLL